MWARFFKFISTNRLVATSLAGFFSFVAGTWFVAWKAPDVGSAFSALGRWLRTPAGATNADIITLTAAAIVLGLVGFAAIFLRETQRMLRREPRTAPEVASPPTSETRVVRATAAEGAPPAADERTASLASWFAGFKAIRGRFAEEEEYWNRSVGTRVRWRGTVYSVDAQPDGRLQLLFSDGAEILEFAYAYFPATFRERLFGLRGGDRIVVVGVIKSASALGPRLDGDLLDVLPQT